MTYKCQENIINNITDGTVVYYHGSKLADHGFAKAFRFEDHYGNSDRYRLVLLAEGQSYRELVNARRASFTVVPVPEYPVLPSMRFKHPLTGDVRQVSDPYDVDYLTTNGYERVTD